MGKMMDGGAAVPHLSELVEAFMEGFGGVRGFARQTIATFHQCMPGSNQQVQILRLVSAMIAKNTEEGGARKPYSQMDESELVAEITKRHQQILLAMQLSPITESVSPEVAEIVMRSADPDDDGLGFV